MEVRPKMYPGQIFALTSKMSGGDAGRQVDAAHSLKDKDAKVICEGQSNRENRKYLIKIEK